MDCKDKDEDELDSFDSPEDLEEEVTTTTEAIEETSTEFVEDETTTFEEETTTELAIETTTLRQLQQLWR